MQPQRGEGVGTGGFEESWSSGDVKRRRRDIFVERPRKQTQAPSGATSRCSEKGSTQRTQRLAPRRRIFFATFARTFAASAFSQAARQFGCGCTGCAALGLGVESVRLPMPLLTELGWVWWLVLQRCRAYGAGTSGCISLRRDEALRR